MTTKRILLAIALILLVGASAVFGAVGGGLLVYRLENQKQADSGGETQSTAVPTPQDATPEALMIRNTDVETTITQVVQQVGPAVVTVVGTVEVQFGFFGQTGTSQVSGSGVFVSQDGYIITNNHVVEDTTGLYVILADGSQYEAALVGTDRYADLAVLKTEAPVPAVAVLGNSDSLDPGETVIAIGSPLGDFMNSVTVGVISATGRSLDTGNGYQIQDLIQTHAAINQGNSGGPLVSLAGEVIGINTMIVRSSNSGTVAEWLGFAIPANTVSAIAGQIIETGHFTRPYIGIEFQPNSSYIAQRYNLATDQGVIVVGISSDSPAEKAGLQVGDIITRIGDVVLDEQHTYINTLFRFEPGDQVTITLVRDGKSRQVDILLGDA